MTAASDDEVDLIITAWASHLPDVDLTPLDVMSRLRRVAAGLARLRGAAFERAGLTIWEFDVLSALRRAGPSGELTASELTVATMVGTPAMSNRLRILTDRGLIARRTAPHDGRVTLVAVTEEGAARVDQAMRELVEAERAALTVLSDAERERLVRTLRVLGSALGGERPASEG